MQPLLPQNFLLKPVTKTIVNQKLKKLEDYNFQMKLIIPHNCFQDHCKRQPNPTEIRERLRERFQIL